MILTSTPLAHRLLAKECRSACSPPADHILRKLMQRLNANSVPSHHRIGIPARHTLIHPKTDMVQKRSPFSPSILSRRIPADLNWPLLYFCPDIFLCTTKCRFT